MAANSGILAGRTDDNTKYAFFIIGLFFGASVVCILLIVNCITKMKYRPNKDDFETKTSMKSK